MSVYVNPQFLHIFKALVIQISKKEVYVKLQKTTQPIGTFIPRQSTKFFHVFVSEEMYPHNTCHSITP